MEYVFVVGGISMCYTECIVCLLCPDVGNRLVCG
jgi:hypothetical protein